jgi:hypothetical protein
VLAQIAREIIVVMKRDVKTDWTVRDDVRAKLTSTRFTYLDSLPRVLRGGC